MSLKSIVIVVLGVFACSSAFALTPAEKQMQKYCNSMTGVRLESFESLSILRTICEMVKLQFTHKKSVSFVTEFLRDWDAIFYIFRSS